MLDPLYGKFGKNWLNKNFLRALLLHRAIGKIHVKKPEC